MRRLLLGLMHEMGTGRALDNARREYDEIARTLAVVDALAGRLPAAATTTGPPAVALGEARVAA